MRRSSVMRMKQPNRSDVPIHTICIPLRVEKSRKL